MTLACLWIYPRRRLVLLIFHQRRVAIQVLRNLDSILFHAYKARLDQILQLKAQLLIRAVLFDQNLSGSIFPKLSFTTSWLLFSAPTNMLIQIWAYPLVEIQVSILGGLATGWRRVILPWAFIRVGSLLLLLSRRSSRDFLLLDFDRWWRWSCRSSSLAELFPSLVIVVHFHLLVLLDLKHGVMPSFTLSSQRKEAIW